MIDGKYMTTAEAAEKWGCSTQVVRKLCRNGRVPGAETFGYDWVIPADAIRPEMGKPGRPSGNYERSNNRMKYEILENKQHGGEHIVYSDSVINAASRIFRGCGCCDSTDCKCGGPQVRHRDGSELTREEKEMFDKHLNRLLVRATEHHDNTKEQSIISFVPQPCKRLMHHV